MSLLPGCPWRPWLEEQGKSCSFGNEVRTESGRIKVTLFQGHRYANSAGQQLRYRLVTCYALSRALRKDEHIHHKNGVIDDDRPGNLELVAASYHGSIHAMAVTLAGGRDSNGRFREYSQPEEFIELAVKRYGPVISRRPIDPVTWEPESKTLKVLENS